MKLVSLSLFIARSTVASSVKFRVRDWRARVQHSLLVTPPYMLMKLGGLSSHWQNGISVEHPSQKMRSVHSMVLLTGNVNKLRQYDVCSTKIRSASFKIRHLDACKIRRGCNVLEVFMCQKWKVV